LGEHPAEIVERQRAEAALRESEEKFRSLAEQSPNMIFINLERLLVYANAMCEKVMGYTKAEFYAPSFDFLTLIAAEDSDSIRATFRQHIQGNDVAPRECTLVTKRGSRLQSLISTKLIHYEGRRAILGIVTDITELKHAEALVQTQYQQLQAQHEELVTQDALLRDAEQELRQMNANLEQRVAARTAELSARTAELSQSNAALARATGLKDEFLASMSHELRTPLTGILGLSESLQLGVYGPLPDKQVKAVQMIYSSGQHLLDLINDILDVSKIEAGKMELQLGSVNVHDVCQASVQFVTQLAQKKKLHLSVKQDLAVGVILADPRRLKQMLVNLLSNAVKFTPEGGAVGLEVVGDAPLKVVRFSVWDTGIGIAPQDLLTLFRPFVQLDNRLSRENSGTGLGLALVMSMAELHGGSVTAESAGVPGQGSRFTIDLPWTSGDEATADRLPEDHRVIASSPSFPAVVVLTIGEASIVGDGMATDLTELGVAEIVHPWGREAVERALEVKPDLILIDLGLPDFSGWEVLDELQANAQTRPLPVMVMSATDDHVQAAARGAVGCLVKPISRSDLLGVIRHALEGPHPHAAPSTVLAGAGVTTPRATVLVVDDNETVLSTLLDFLQSQALEVLTAHNGSEALELLTTTRPEIILMDIQMPGMDGLEAIRRIRANADSRLASVPIIALTALAMPDDRERCLAAGANAYLVKPMRLAKVGQTIETLLGTSLEGGPQAPPNPSDFTQNLSTDRRPA
jgi:PAS domain S-box-containing protein